MMPGLGNYHNDDAYILYFKDDSAFQLNTGTNLAKGNFVLFPDGSISVSNYQEYTEIGTVREEERQFNDLQIELFPKVKTYKKKVKL